MTAQADGVDDLLGSTTSFAPSQGHVRLDIAAVLRQQPAVSSIDTSSGPITGGTPVTISGHEFTGATAVSFGSTPASSFTVSSDEQITAVSPVAAPGTVDLTVTTPLGRSPTAPADNSTYTACVVPKLSGHRLRADRKMLKVADCRLGTIKGKGAGPPESSSRAPGRAGCWRQEPLSQ